MNIAGLLPVFIGENQRVARHFVPVELPAVVDAVGGAGVVLLVVLLAVRQVGLLSRENSSDITEMETINPPIQKLEVSAIAVLRKFHGLFNPIVV